MTRQRWWDGQQWTDERRDTPARDDRPWWKKKRFIVPIAVVLLFGIVTAGGTEEEATVAEQPGEDQPAEPSGPRTDANARSCTVSRRQANTDPFNLDGGHYVMTLTAAGDFFYSFTLRRPDGGGFVDLGGMGEPGERIDNVYGVDAGEWYLDVITGPPPNCPWTLELSPRR